MKTKIAAALVVLVAGLSAGLLWNHAHSADVVKTPATPAPAVIPMTNAFLFGESIPKPLQPGEQPGFGIGPISHIEWWLGTPDGKKLRKLNDPKTGRIAARPVGRTVVLKRDDNGLTLLGPDGADLVLSLKDGPLAAAQLHDPIMQITTFSFPPDGKYVYFVNARDRLCRVALATRQLSVLGLTGVDPGRGIQFSPDGARIAYSTYFRKDDFSTGVHSVHVANADGTASKKLTDYADGSQLGFGFLPDGRVAVVGPTAVRAFDPRSGEVKTIVGPWQEPLQYRSFGGFNPDGSTFIYDLGGPYQLRLFAFDLKTQQVTTVRDRYLESFQLMVWVRVPVSEK